MRNTSLGMRRYANGAASVIGRNLLHSSGRRRRSFAFPRAHLRFSLANAMLLRAVVILSLCASLVQAADNPSPGPPVAPTEASIKQLLEVAEAHKLVDSVMKQIDN